MPWLSTADDANKFLDSSKVQVTDADDNPEQTSAEALIRAYLSGRIDPVVMATWDITTPASVPLIIREIAGRLVAALRYRRLVSESSVEDVAPYAMQLYNEAMALLMGILDGSVQIAELITDPIGGISLTEDHFYPNDTTVGAVDDVKFSMGMNL